LNEVRRPLDRPGSEIDEVAIQISRLSADLQNEIIQARMTPVWQVFDRFPRLVRDVARQLGRRSRSGSRAKRSSSTADPRRAGDPLVHLLRNAVDHGIESPADRKRAKKNQEGEMCCPRCASVPVWTISISTTGAARPQRILAKAQREGIVGARRGALGRSAAACAGRPGSRRRKR